jgi:hypothetical protein
MVNEEFRDKIAKRAPFFARDTGFRNHIISGRFRWFPVNALTSLSNTTIFAWVRAIDGAFSPLHSENGLVCSHDRSGMKHGR